MSGKIEISRDQLDCWLIALNARSSVTAPIKKMRNELRALLAAPVVERQPVAAPVEIHRQLIEMRQQHERANFVALGKSLSACLDMVKELNQ